MHDLVIAGVQTRQFWEDKTQNLQHFEELLKTTNLSDVDVLVFPEMFHTGFTMNAEELAEEMHASIGIAWLKQISNTYTCLTIVSLIIKEAGKYYNRMVAVFPNGTLLHYDKRHLFSLAGEDNVFSPGNSDTIVSYKGWKIKLQVCFDLRFPEGARNGIGDDGQPFYDLLIYNANWPARRIAHWDILVPARAVENQSYVMAINRVGKDGNDIAYNGHSVIYNPSGQLLISAHENSEEIIKHILSTIQLNEFRTSLPFLKEIVH